MKILAVLPGEFKSATCVLDTETTQTKLWAMNSEERYLNSVLQVDQPNPVVINTCRWPPGCTMPGRAGALTCWWPIPDRKPGSGRT